MSRPRPPPRPALPPRGVALAALAACGVDLKLPAGAQVTCGSDADCPGGWVCRTTLGRCVQPGGDVTAPQLVASSLVVTPARVGAGIGAVTVAFQVSEALAADPEAYLRLSGAGAPARALTVVSRDPATHGYVLSYAPSPGSDAEGDVSFVARLLDAAGNEGRVELPRVAVLDFTRPALAVDLGDAPMVSIALTPPAASPLREVSAATVGTRLRVDFASNEPLAGAADAPVVTLGAGGSTLTLAQVSGNGLSFVYQAELGAGFPEGPAALAAHLVDLAGNPADVPLGTVQVRTQRPSAPAVGTADAIVFHRVPWGSEATGGAEAYFLRGAAGAAPAGAVVVAYSDPTVITSAGALVGREIARVQADATTGAFGGDVGDPAPFALYMGDAPDLYVAAVDAAGNVSDADGDPANGVQAALVRDVSWTATMIGKIPGRVFPNPHAFEGRQVWTDTLAQRGSKPVATPAEVGRQDGTAASTRGAPYWLPAPRYGPLGYRAGMGVAHDPVRGCRVSFGGESWDGCDSGWFCNQWESCRGSAWSVPAPADPEGDGNPALGSGLPLVFAGGRGTAVLSDGADLWEWDGGSWRKVVMVDPEGDGDPAPRSGHALAYDEGRQRLVLFGGAARSGGALLSDTWETDFRSWKRVCTAAPCSTTRPAARSAHAMVYDPARKATLLVGGRISSTPTYDPATWTWNGTAWTQRCTAAPCLTSSPAQREATALAFDPVRARAVLFGGTTAGVRSGGTYEWDGTLWTAVTPSSSTNPEPRAHHALFHDPGRGASGRTVLFGGEVGGFGGAECPGNFCGTEWEWDGSAWTQVTAVGSGPPAVSDVTPVYDPIRDRVVLFGGRTGGAYSSATWLWDGSGWAAGAPTRVPPARGLYGATWVSTGYVFAPGGYVALADGQSASGGLASTATWDGSNWTTLAGGPSARRGAAMAQSLLARPGGGALLFGGVDDAMNEQCDTWQLSAGTWTRLLNPTCATTTGPSARFSHAMARATGFSGAPVLLMGGQTNGGVVNDLWAYSATGWAQLSAGGPAGPTQPPARVHHGLLFDTDRNRALLFGGDVGPVVSNVNCVDDYGGTACHDFWEWSGTAWTRVWPVDLYGDGNPDPYALAGVAFDTTRRLGVGLETSGSTLATWWWHGGAADAPGHVMSVVFDAAEVRRAYDVVDLQVTWVGGASGAPGGATSPGASVQLWDNQGWRPLLSSASASPTARETLRWSLLADPLLGTLPLAERQRFMVGDQRLLTVALVPAAASGRAAGFGEVSTDYAEVTVRYRLGP